MYDGIGSEWREQMCGSGREGTRGGRNGVSIRSSSKARTEHVEYYRGKV